MNRPNFHCRWDTEVFIMEGDSRQGLIKAGQRILQLLSVSSELDPKDLAYSLNCPLHNPGYRLAIVADSLNDFKEKLDYGLKRLDEPTCVKIKDRSGIYFFEEPLSREGSLAFLFSGEGSQYFNMLSDICLHFPEVRLCLDITERVFCEEKREILPSQLLYMPRTAPGSSNDRIDQELWEINLAVAMVFTADYALWRLLDRLEIRAQAVVGHSSGEFAALMAAGAMKAESIDELVGLGRDLIRLYTSLEEPLSNAKLMTVGIADPAVVASAVEESNGELYVALDNCPHQVILCGDETTIYRARDQLINKGAICEFLPYPRPYHTPLYRKVSKQFSHFFQRRKIVPPDVALYSCATTEPYPSDPSGIRHLAVDQWTRPVRFRETIKAMYDAGVRIFVEVGPRGNLTSFVDDILAKLRYLSVPSDLPGRSGITQMNHMIGLLAANGVEMRLDYLYERRAPTNVLAKESSNSEEQPRKSATSVRLTPEAPRLQLNAGSQMTGSHASRPFHRTLSPFENQTILTQNEKRTAGSDQHQEHPTARRVRPHASRSRVMQEYMNTMERFLDMQRELMVASLHKGNDAASETSPAKRRGR